MDWVFKAHQKVRINEVVKNHGEVNEHTRESRRLKYCEDCERVWEVGFTGAVHSYGHLPTYGLLRKTCRICENK